jgi:hypothetical protein
VRPYPSVDALFPLYPGYPRRPILLCRPSAASWLTAVYRRYRLAGASNLDSPVFLNSSSRSLRSLRSVPDVRDVKPIWPA